MADCREKVGMNVARPPQSAGGQRSGETPSVARPKADVKLEPPTMLGLDVAEAWHQWLNADPSAYQAVFCAALTGLLANRYISAADAVRFAREVVEEAKKERS